MVKKWDGDILNCPSRTHSAVGKAFDLKVLLIESVGWEQVQYQQPVRRITNTSNNLTLVSGHGEQNWKSVHVIQIKGSISRFCVDSLVRHQTHEEGRTYRPKRCDYNNKDEVNCPNILSNNNYQSSSKKFR